MRNWRIFIFCAFLVKCSQLVEAIENESPTGSSLSHISKAETENGGQKYTQEIECSRVGGICISQVDCPAAKISKEGACPKQTDAGAVCCHSLSLSESVCQNLGGQCRESCPEDLVISRASDCENGMICCPLV